jgi:4-hydroxymandelate oxidase
VLNDVSTVELSTTVLGTAVDVPVLVAPSTMHRMADPDGETAMARGVGAANSLIGISSNAGTTFAEIGATGVPWWLQIYIVRNREITKRMLDAAVEAGARAVVLTVDTPVVGRKEDTGQTVWDLEKPGHWLANLPQGDWADDDLAKADDLSPDAIGWLAERTGLPVVVKGVLRGDDAKRCTDAGAAGVIVSNHGGRQLDGSMPTAQALPEVAEALAGTGAEVYVDGGIRRGEHILTALALGARGLRRTPGSLGTHGRQLSRRHPPDHRPRCRTGPLPPPGRLPPPRRPRPRPRHPPVPGLRGLQKAEDPGRTRGLLCAVSRIRLRSAPRGGGGSGWGQPGRRDPWWSRRRSS